jgi:ankyrin repeat protein
MQFQTLKLIWQYALLADPFDFKAEKGTKKKAWKEARVVMLDAGIFVFMGGDKPDYHILFCDVWQDDTAFDERDGSFIFGIDLGKCLCSFRTTDKSVFDNWKTLLLDKTKGSSTSSPNVDLKAQSSDSKAHSNSKHKAITSPRDSPAKSSEKRSSGDKKRVPLHFGDRLVSDAAAVDHVALSRQIESLFEKDVWYETKLELGKYLALKGPMSNTALLLRRCDRPCYMLKEDWPHVDPRIDPRVYSRIDALIKELESERDKESPSDPQLASMLDSLAKYYQKEVARMKEHGYMAARVPPTTLTIVAANSTRCIVSASALELMDHGTLQTTGHNPVRFLKDMYWKEDPELPGTEFAVDLLYKKVMSRGSPPSMLVKREQYDPLTMEPSTKLYQTSLGVEGHSLNEMDTVDPSWVSSIKRSNFSFMYVMALLTLPQDGKGDNIIVTKVDQKYHLTSIDNDHSFADPVCVYRDSRHENKHCVNVKSILFCFPQAKEKFSKSVRNAILAMSPELITISWLEELQKQNLLYDSLLQQNAFTREEYENSKLPIRLRSGTAQRVYDTLKAIQSFLEPSDNITPDTIFAQLYPTCHAYYQYVEQLHVKQKASIPTLFASGIFTGNSFESYPDLLEREVRYDKVGVGKQSEPDSMKVAPLTLSGTVPSGPKMKVMLDVYNETRLDHYETKRTKLPYEELETLLQNMDLSRLKSEFEVALLSNLCDSSMSYMHFTLIGSRLFNASQLKAIVGNSKALTCLELHHCPNISVREVVEVMSIARFKGKIIISGAAIATNVDRSQLDAEVTLTLQVATPERFVIEQTEKIRRTQVSPYTYANLISEALEFIRAGSFLEAKTKLEAALKLQPKVLQIFRTEIEAVLSKDVLRNLMASPCLEFIELLLKHKLLDVNQKSSEGLSPWHMAVRNGHLELCKLLLSQGAAAVDAVTLQDHRTGLHLAALLGHIAVLDWLLGLKNSNAPDVNARDSWMHTPLSLALVTRYPTSKLQIEVVERLLKAKPDLALQYEKEAGNTALHLALHYELPEIAKLLISANAPLYLVNNAKQTVLHTAVLRNLHVELLLEKKANPNQKNAHGKTPLMIAAQNGNIPALESLLRCSSISVNIQDESEHTALRMAVENGNVDAIKLLIEKGKADPNLPDLQGISPMWRAASMIYKVASSPKPPKFPPPPSLIDLPAFSEHSSSPTKPTTKGSRSKSIGGDKKESKDSLSGPAAASSSNSNSSATSSASSSTAPPISSATSGSTASLVVANGVANAASSSAAPGASSGATAPTAGQSPSVASTAAASGSTIARPATPQGKVRKLPPPSIRLQDGAITLPHTPDFMHSSGDLPSPTSPTSSPRLGAILSPRKSTSPHKKSGRPKASSSGKSTNRKSGGKRKSDKETDSPRQTLREAAAEGLPWLRCAEYLLAHKGDLRTPNTAGQTYLAFLGKRILASRAKCGPPEVQFLIDNAIPLDGLNSDGRNILHVLLDADWSQGDLWSSAGEKVAVDFFLSIIKTILDSMTPAQRHALLFQEDRYGHIPINLSFRFGAKALDFYIADGGIPTYVASLSKSDYEVKHPFLASLMAPTPQPLETMARTHPELLTSSIFKLLKKKAPTRPFTALLESLGKE